MNDVIIGLQPTALFGVVLVAAYFLQYKRSVEAWKKTPPKPVQGGKKGLALRFVGLVAFSAIFSFISSPDIVFATINFVAISAMMTVYLLAIFRANEKYSAPS